jgi:hypothetical protein
VENRICLSRDVKVIGATWRAIMRIVAGVADRCRGSGMVKHKSGTRCPEDREVE